MPAGRGLVGGRQVGMDLVGVIHQRPEEGESRDEHQDDQAHDGELVLHEHVKPAQEQAARFCRGQRPGCRLGHGHELTYLTRGSRMAYRTSATSEPTTVATATTTTMPSSVG